MILSISTLIFFCYLQVCYGTNYHVGAGIADVTGPAAELNMMGYANPGQISHGIHMRQMARTFIFSESATSPRVVFINLEAAWAGGAVKREVLKQLNTRYGSLYTEKNVCISGTHTHSGVGGYSQYLLFDITAFGFNKQAFNALVDGVVLSVVKAHESMQPADIYMNRGELLDSNINRSPTAYLNNPAEERSKYKYNVDKDMVLLKIVDAKGQPIGLLNWFAVHCTSMNNTNQMISSDNKGYAAQLMEAMFNDGAHPGNGSFVAVFAQSNEGDVSPNTRGPHCLDTGLPCDVAHSTCNNRTELCIAFGPGKDMFESTQIIGSNQFKKALDLFKSASIKLSGPIDSRHTFADMTSQIVTLKNGTKVKTCKPSMGYSFAAGTTDGPGAFDFTQGTTSSNPMWNLIRNLITKPSDELVNCHKPKPILLPTGEMHFRLPFQIGEPYLWQPETVGTQLLRIGQFVIIPVPGEFTTMSGRRLRDAVAASLKSNSKDYDNVTVVVAGLSNEYADYITTHEEYQVQRYEGGSTVYGPHTLEAYLQIYSGLAKDMATGAASAPGVPQPDLMSRQIALLPGVIMDEAPLGRSYGQVLTDAGPAYAGGDEVSVTFQSANPRNNLRNNGTFLTVEKKDSTGNWIVVATDAHWETRFQWERTSTLLGYSVSHIQWAIPKLGPTGTFRIRHFGCAKSLTGHLSEFVGSTREFKITSSKTY